jgi:hypothetical protein
MAGATNSQTVAYQREKLLEKVSVLFHRDHTFFDKIEKKNLEKVSSRAMRIPLDILAGGKFSQATMDGADLGRGSGLTADVAQISAVYFTQATEFTKLAEAATDGNEKAVESSAKRNLKAAVDQIRFGLESLLMGDGSGTLDTVVSAAGSAIVVNNPNQFYDGQDINVYAAVGGAQRGATATISSVDQMAKTLNLVAAFPVGTVGGDVIVTAGSAAVASSSLFGLKYHHVDANTGTWMQLNRATYPGKLRTPHVATGGNAVTPGTVRLAISKVQQGLGIDSPDAGNLQWVMNLESVAGWENNGLVVAQTIQNQITGDSSIDMLKKNPPMTMGGRPIIQTLHGNINRIDGVCLDHWGRAELQPIGPLEYGGQRMFPIYGASGGLASSTISYLWCGFNVFSDNPRAGVFIDGMPLTAGY